MTLKELVEFINNQIKSEKWEVDEISDDAAIPMTSIEDMMEAVKPLGDIDEDDIRHINTTFWTSGITSINEMTAETMVANCLFAKCRTDEERKATLKWLTDLEKNTCLPIIRKLNRWQSTKKRVERDSLYGEFTKFDLIQRYAFLYDSNAEADADANDKSATCPLIMSYLNSGWQNFMAVEDKRTGKITVSRRYEDEFLDDCDMFLGAVQSQFETLYEQEKQLDELRMEEGRWMVRDYAKSWPNAHYIGKYEKKQGEYLAIFGSALMDEDLFPQDVADFSSVNEDFLKVIANALEITNGLDETQHELARELYANTLDNMATMADFECRIVREQNMRDPSTKKFIKPRFDCENLCYCGALADVLSWLQGTYDEVMRIDTTKMHIDDFCKFKHPLTEGLDGYNRIHKYCRMKEECMNEITKQVSCA